MTRIKDYQNITKASSPINTLVASSSLSNKKHLNTMNSFSNKKHFKIMKNLLSTLSILFVFQFSLIAQSAQVGLQIAQGGNTVTTLVSFGTSSFPAAWGGQDYTMGYDDWWDAQHLDGFMGWQFGQVAQNINPAYLLGPIQLNVNSIPETLLQGNTPITIDLFFYTWNNPQNFTISLSSFSNMPTGWVATLYDNELGVIHELNTAGAYPFTGQGNTSYSRFHLTIGPGAVAAIDGCTDTLACNYDPNATNDDGSCGYNSNPVVDLTQGTWTMDRFSNDCSSLIQTYNDVFTSNPASLASGSGWQVSPISSMSLCGSVLTIIYPGGYPTYVYTYSNGIFTLDPSLSNASYQCMEIYQDVPGCTDPNACNYDAAATADDGSCVLPTAPYDCNGNCANGGTDVTITVGGGTYDSEISWDITDGSGTVVASGNAGTSTAACLPDDCYTFNMYDSWGDGWNGGTYDISDGSGSIASGGLTSGSSGSDLVSIGGGCVSGCTDTLGTNYNPSAQIDDGTCVYPACSQAAPTCEDFNSGAVPTAVCANGWSISATSGSGWVFTGTPGYQAGANGRPAGSYAWIDFSGTDAGVVMNMDPVDVSGLTTPTLTFAYFSDVGTYTLSTPNILNVEAYNGTSWNSIATYQELNTGWVNKFIDVSAHAVSGVVTLRLRAESGGDGGDYLNDLLVDDVCFGEAPVLGCTDASAFNYDPSATLDDGSCVPVVLGCTDSLAANYDPNANTNDNSCNYGVPGCTDPLACNFDPAATADDGSCFGPQPPLDCNGDCANGGVYILYTAGNWASENSFTITDCDGNVLAEMTSGSNGFDDCVVLPATYSVNLVDSYGDGWNGGELEIDGSIYTIASGASSNTLVGGPCPVYGCMDPAAANYDPNATVNATSSTDPADPCTYGVPGCTDPLACNFDPAANADDGSCIPPPAPYDCNGNCANGGTDVTITVGGGQWDTEISWDLTDGSGTVVASGGAGTSTACLPDDCYTFNMYDSYGDGWNGGTYDISDGSGSIASGGLTSGASGSDAVSVGGVCIPGCTDASAFNYDASAQIDDGSCVPVVLGCTDANAANYDPNANTDDSTCTYGVPGCTDNTACNYDPAATADDGTCTFAQAPFDCNGNCANGGTAFTITVGGGSYDSEISWDITDGSGTVVASGNAGTSTACLPDDCYTFNMYDSWGDGWNGGTYDISDGSGSIASGGLTSGALGSDAVSVGGVCIPGCTDASAFNYDPSAQIDDGSCVAVVNGCTDPNAYNYDPSANTDDGSCIAVVNGCTDPNAYNYDPNANTDDGSCIAFAYGCTDSGANNYDPNANTDDGSCTYTVSVEFNVNMNTQTVSANGVHIAGTFNIWSTQATQMSDLDGDGIYSVTIDFNQGEYIEYKFINGDYWGADEILQSWEACQTNGNRNLTVASSSSATQVLSPVCFGQCINCIIDGCTDPNACNYNPLANNEDGSCILPPAQPTLACYESATYNAVTCSWDVTGTQPAAPTGLACYESATFNTVTCSWDVSGTQPTAPTNLACYEIATWNGGTCVYDVTGTQPAAPTGLACYETATWNGGTCVYDVTGTQPAAPTGLACHETANWNGTTCVYDITSTGSYVTIQLDDSYGDGWNGGNLNVNGIDYTISSGSSETYIVCLDLLTCINVDYTAGSWASENSFTITDASGAVLASMSNGSVGYNAGPIGTCVPGCTDANAFNYDPLAQIDDGSCVPVISGCMDPAAANYDPNANTSDSSCTYGVPGCTDNTACNYDPAATADDGSCTFAQAPFDCNGDCANGGVYILYTADGWPSENSFTITDCDGNVLASMTSGNNGFDDCVVLPATYSVNLVDSYGDGWNGGELEIDGTIYTIASGASSNTLVGGPCPVYGCTDPAAANYDSTATVNATSSTDPTDPCNYGVPGCTDTLACNYDPAATADDGTCTFAQAPFDCNGNCANGGTAFTITVGGGSYDSEISWDITDGSGHIVASGGAGISTACLPDDCYTFNMYDSYGDGWNGGTYDISDGSGSIASGGLGFGLSSGSDAVSVGGVCIPGCTDASAFNYDPSAQIDDGSCVAVVNGCTDALACNYDPNANTSDGSCTYPDPNADCSGNCLSGYINVGGACVAIVNGCTDLLACNYDPNANTNDNSCTYANPNADCSGNCLSGYVLVNGVCVTQVDGCTDPNAYNYDPNANVDDGSCISVQPGCTDALACNYNPNANTSDGSCTYPAPNADCAGNCLSGYILVNGVCVTQVDGCMDPSAMNYDANANFDDGSCIYGVSVEFNVNMNTQTVSANGVYVAGTFDGWTPGVTQMLDLDGDGIYSVTLDLAAGSYHEYKFINGNAWGDDEILQSWEACQTNGNRSITVANSGSQVLSPVCFASCNNCVIDGCTDASACNYDANATNNDGSCTFAQAPFDCNGNCANGDTRVTLNLDDSWGDGWNGGILTVNGVDYTVSSGNNFNVDLCLDLTTCIFVDYTAGGYPSENSFTITDASGNVLADMTSGSNGFNGTIGTCVSGCTDSIATNYDSSADIDDGSCTYVPGCTDTLATNYDPSAQIDDGTCVYPACSVGAPTCEDFNSGVLPTAACVDGWAISATNGDGWRFTGTPGYHNASAGTPGTFAWIDFSGSDIGVVMQMDPVDVSGLTLPTLTFSYWSVDGGTSITTPNILHVEAYNGTSWDSVATYQEFNTGWVNKVIDVSAHAVSGVVTLRLRGESGGNSSDWYNDLLVDDVCIGDAPVLGCTDTTAFNYDPSATLDDGSCIPVVLGCMDSLAANYDPNANTNDNSCTYGIPGCTDTLACNYDPAATADDNSCTYAQAPFDCNGDCANGGVYVSYAPGSWSYENNFTITDCDGNVVASMTGGSGFDQCVQLGAIYTIDLVDTYGDGWNGGTLTVDGVVYTINSGAAGSFQVGGPCPIYGCMDPSAANYDSTATVNETSSTDPADPCTYGVPGCTDTLACNFDPAANANDNSCVYPPAQYDCDTNCINGGTDLTITVGGGSWQGEVSWSLVDGSGTVVASGGAPFTGNFCLLDDCYTLIMNDSYGDGWNGNTYSIDDNNSGTNYGTGGLASGASGSDQISIGGGCVPGCTDTTAFNYDPSAQIDDGSCVPVVVGCMDSLAANYDPNANTPDTSCTYGVPGCTDTLACNYDPAANADDGSCTFANAPLDCNGNCANGGTAYTITVGGGSYDSEISWDLTDGSGAVVASGVAGTYTACLPDDCYRLNMYDSWGDGWNGATYDISDGSGSIASGGLATGASGFDAVSVGGGCVPGCTDPAAYNYDSNAQVDDGSCISVVYGCTDPAAANYDSLANTDDSTCIYGVPGCTDTLACNYDPAATADDGSCILPQAPLDCNGNCANGATAYTITVGGGSYDSEISWDLTDGSGSVVASGGAGTSTACLPDDCYTFNMYDSWGDGWNGGTYDISDGSGSIASGGLATGASGSDQISIGGACVPGCTDTTAINYDPNAQIDDGSCVPVVLGCMDSLAANYDPNANTDDSTCTYGVPGCTDTLACNYDPAATANDGSCTFANAPLDCNGNCANGGTAVTLTLWDSYGDGWNGGFVTIDGVDYTQIGTYTSPYTVNASESFTICIDLSVCTDVVYTAGSYSYENAWDITDANGIVIASGGNASSAVGNCIQGCTDTLAFNYDSLAQVDDGSCIAVVFGCLDSLACNYDPNANTDDGYCYYGTNQPTLACYETATFDVASCSWIVTGTQPAAPTNLACYETATWNGTTCVYDVTGTQPAAPTGLACYETATWNGTTCAYDVSGTQPTAPTGLACHETATWNGATCVYDINSTGPASDVTITVGGGAWDSEISWDLADGSGAVVASGNAGTFTACLPDDCYTFNMYDSYGDGWNGGVYSVTDNASGTVYGTGGLATGASGSDRVSIGGVCVLGCTDASAFNYDPSAQINDGSCVPVVIGCTDTLAANYDPNANTPDTSCTYGVPGCTDTLACNYDPAATADDGSCTFAQAPLDCNGACPNGGIYISYTAGSYPGENSFTIEDCDGNVMASMTSGNNGFNQCIVLPSTFSVNLVDSWGDGWNGGILTIDGIDYTIANGASSNTIVGGPCPVYGCTDPAAANYDSTATVNATSSTDPTDPCSYGVPGCIDTLACNYDPAATADDGSCTFAQAPLDCNGNCVNGGVYILYTAGGWASENSFTITDCDGNVLAEMTSGSNGFDDCVVLPATYSVNLVDSYGDGWNGGELDIDGTIYTIASGANSNTIVGGPCPVYGCTDPSAANYDSTATVNATSSTDPTDPCSYGVPGCTDTLACNYDPAATADDGSCFGPTAPFDCNGNCANGGTAVTVTLYDSYGDGGGQITVDGNVLTNSGSSNSMVVCIDLNACTDVIYAATDWWPSENSWDVTDALGNVLASGGNASGQVGTCAVPGCMDSTACNYDPLATADDGSCNYGPAMPTLACYETATFNIGTCSWDVTGTQPAAPTNLACYESSTFNT
ncbi:MAG: hypothetical protein MK207_04820, partial [Saprospiraceae bacterium]|nr:hypothetical protein [Saprospiraceae bacterium]